MLRVVDYHNETDYTVNMKRSDRYIGITNGKRYWKALVCQHAVPGYYTQKCWDCWKLDMSKARTGIKKKVVHKGKDHHSWKGGTTISQGYILIKNSDHPSARANGYVSQHRLVMEKHIGRYLQKGEEVHHINHNKADNRLSNLMLFSSHSEHMAYEHKEGDRLNA